MDMYEIEKHHSEGKETSIKEQKTAFQSDVEILFRQEPMSKEQLRDFLEKDRIDLRSGTKLGPEAYDEESWRWFKSRPGAVTTIAQCDICRLFYVTEIKHKCPIVVAASPISDEC